MKFELFECSKTSYFKFTKLVGNFKAIRWILVQRVRLPDTMD